MEDEKIQALFQTVKTDIAQEIIAHLDKVAAAPAPRTYDETLQLFIDHGIPLIISSVNDLEGHKPIGEWVVSLKGINELTATSMETVKVFLETYIKDHIARLAP